MRDRTRCDRAAGFTLLELLVVLAITGVVVGLLLPAVQRVREAATRSKCRNNLKQLGTALHAYHDAYGRFPSGGDRLNNLYAMGWTARILPFIEEDARYRGIDRLTTNAFKRVMPWRYEFPPHYGKNPLYTDPVKPFVCPGSELGALSPDVLSLNSQINAPHQGALHYRANGGTPTAGLTHIPGDRDHDRDFTTSGIIYPESNVRLTDITDGTSTTILVGESSSALGWRPGSKGWGGIQPWTWGFSSASPAEGYLMIDHKYVQHPIGYAGDFLPNATPFRSAHANQGANLLFADGSVRYLPATTGLALLQALSTRDGGEVIPSF